MNEFSDDHNFELKDKKEKFKAHLSSKGITIDFQKEEIEKYLPNLVQEIKSSNEGSYYSIDKKLPVSNDKEHSEEFNNDNIYSTNLKKKQNPKEENIENLKKRVSSKYDKNSELFYPKTEDFLRRCENIKEAEDIISFQLKTGEIDAEKANYFLNICRNQGLEYFGPRKKYGYYEKKYRRIVY